MSFGRVRAGGRNAAAPGGSNQLYSGAVSEAGDSSDSKTVFKTSSISVPRGVSSTEATRSAEIRRSPAACDACESLLDTLCNSECTEEFPSLPNDIRNDFECPVVQCGMRFSDPHVVVVTIGRRGAFAENPSMLSRREQPLSPTLLL